MVHHDQPCAFNGESYRRASVAGYFARFQKVYQQAILKAIAENQRESRKEWLLKQFITPDGNRFWRADNKPIELWSNAAIDQKLNYIHQNPVEEGLVFRAEDYVYSSANDYAGGRGLLDILVI